MMLSYMFHDAVIGVHSIEMRFMACHGISKMHPRSHDDTTMALDQYDLNNANSDATERVHHE